MKAIWGKVTDEGGGVWELEAQRDTLDGIGSVLALIGPVSQTVGRPTRVTWDETEHWGGDEQWRSFWLMFPCNEENLWPMFYMRPTLQAIEVGWVMTKDPTSQVILESIVLPPRCVFMESISLLVEGERLTIGVDVFAADMRGKSKVPGQLVGRSSWFARDAGGLGAMALTFTRKGIQIPGFETAWPPIVAAYCEASRVRVRVS